MSMQSHEIEPQAARVIGTGITPKENLILQYMAAGHSAKSVAIAIDRSPRTVEGYIQSIKQKLDARTVAQACVIGVTRGIITV